MKKFLTLLMAAILLIGAAVMPALAGETESAPDQVASATAQAGNGNAPALPQMPGQDSTQNVPQMPGQDSTQNVPQMPGRNSGNGQTAPQNGMPGRGGRNAQQGRNFGNRNGGAADFRNGKPGKLADPDQLLADGVITQEIYDAIIAWLNEKSQTQAAPAAPAGNAEAPAAPEAAQESPALQLLKELLDSGVITQEQYDQLAPGYTAAEPAGNS